MHRMTRPCGALMAVCTALAFTVADGSSAAAIRVRTVTVGSNFYDPPRLNVKRGDQVRWIWESFTARHNVSVRSGPERFKSPTQSSGTYSRRFRKRGTFKLYCTQHRMSMTLIVRR